MRDVVITGMGHCHPPHELSNEFFGDLGIDSSAEWIRERTGIKARYSTLSPQHIRSLSRGESSIEEIRQEPGFQSMVELSEDSWRLAKERSRLASEPNLIISGTSIPDYFIPASAALIARRLGFSSTTFDAQSACSSFVTNLAIAKAMLKDEQFDSAAIFNIERYTLSMDYADRRSCVLFGDGSAATILEVGGDSSGLKIVDTLLHSQPGGCDNIQIPVGGHFYQNGARVQKFAVSKTVEASSAILKRNGLSSDDLAYFVGHQANLRMLQSVCQKLDIGEDRHLYNVDLYGNQGAAGAPVTLSMNWDRYNVGDLILVAVVGAGLTWGAALLQRV